jgi:hypothetical protein
MTSKASFLAPPARDSKPGRSSYTREADLIRDCLTYLNLRKIEAWRVNVSGAYNERAGRWVKKKYCLRGVADINGILPGGRFLAVECKTRNDRTRPEQEAFLEMVRRAGAVGIVARGIEDIEKGLKEA